MAQSYNLYDVYATCYGQILGGLLARADFPASSMTLQQINDVVEPMALSAVRRIAVRVGDMSTLAPPVTDFDAGWTGTDNLFNPPAAQAPPAEYVAPNAVRTPSGSYVEPENTRISG